MDSEGLRAILGRFTPKIGGRPPQKLAPVCPQGSPTRPSMAAFQSVTGLNRGPFRGLCTRRPSKNPHLGRFFPVAVVEKFRSRIRILQFSTGKITPHGCVYVSSARPPIDLQRFFNFRICAEPIWGSLISTSLRLTPLRRPLRRGTPGLGFFVRNSVKKGPSQDRTPIPQ